VSTDKKQVYEFWNDASCGEQLYLQGSDRKSYELQSRKRYELEPFIVEFADFESAAGKRVLEIGVGLGADHLRFAQAGAELSGIDLTERAVEHTQRRLAAYGLSSHVMVGDAEALDFPDEYFDQVFSWGVLHHSPDTRQAVSEVWRVLKPGGRAAVMVYHKWSLVGLMLWVRYALLRCRPWLSMRTIYANYLESPGTKAYSVAEAARLFSVFREVQLRTVLSHGDLLDSLAGQRHQGVLLSLARKMWPRSALKSIVPGLGLFMLIEARR
jgi:ubiquinone/menaquinone biosynthesis C-methylase UbiE